ncbi:MAG: hypothetical protein HFE73_01510 [Firmicutes bacterium]|nr:hypothetical protein [Bacillota bacterium]
MKEWFDGIWEFGQDHLTALIVAAVILAVLLISMLFARSARREALMELEDAEEGFEEKDFAEEEGQASGQDQNFEKVEPSDKTQIPLVSEELQNMVHTMTNLPLQNLKSVELKIEKAQLTLCYDLASQEGDSGSSNSKESADETTQMEILSEPVSVDLTVPTDLKDMEMERFSDEDLSDKSKPVVKFGAENLNVTRSGREFTIEELYHQIKD